MNGSVNTVASPTIKATYSNSTTTKVFEKSSSASGQTNTDTNPKVTYLNSLRVSTKHLQDEINSFLTAKMEEDKAAATSSTNTDNLQGSKARDEEEEENYGEEQVEDE